MFAQKLLDGLHAHGVRMIAGVPDSILKGFCASVTQDARFEHIIAANEGAALTLAAGHHLATGRLPAVYLQNSGLANALNPYLSMCHPTVYDLPAVLVIGWRGQPGVADEPQHRKMGSITLDLLRLIDARTVMLTDSTDQALERVNLAVASAVGDHCTLAIVASKGVLDDDVEKDQSRSDRRLRRSDVIKAVLAVVGRDDVVFGGIGHVSRELLAMQASAEQAGAAEQRSFHRDFLCVGGMGYVHQIAIGYARDAPKGRIWCLDGDGALLMHLGTLSSISTVSRPFIHLLFDNGVHASVGGQPVSGGNIDYGGVARALGYSAVCNVASDDQLRATMPRLRDVAEPTFVWARVSPEVAGHLPRPRGALVDLKHEFLRDGSCRESRDANDRS